MYKFNNCKRLNEKIIVISTQKLYYFYMNIKTKQSNIRFQQQQNKKLESKYEERAGSYYLKEDLNKSKGGITNLTKYKKGLGLF